MDPRGRIKQPPQARRISERRSKALNISGTIAGVRFRRRDSSLQQAEQTFRSQSSAVQRQGDTIAGEGIDKTRSIADQNHSIVFGHHFAKDQA